MELILTPRHPGVFIRTYYIEPLNIQHVDLANILDVSQSAVSRLLNGKSDLSFDMAVRLSKALDRTPEYFMNLQVTYGLAKAKNSINLDNVKKISTAD